MRLIAAVDGPDSQRVLKHAARVADALGADVEAMHVGGQDTPPALVRLTECEDVVGTVVGTGTVTRPGQPAGDLATDLMTQLPGLLVLVPPGADDTRPIRRVLVALDGHAETTAALEAVIDTMRGRAVEVVVVHVIDDDAVPPYVDQPNHWSTAFATEFRARHIPSQDVPVELRCGDPAARVLDAADQTHADLIALAWHQQLRTGRAQVVRRAVAGGRLPVLLIPVGTPLAAGD